MDLLRTGRRALVLQLVVALSLVDGSVLGRLGCHGGWSGPVCTMGFVVPDLDLARVRKWVDERNAALPSRASGLVRYEIDVSSWVVTVVECRPPWPGGLGTDWTRFLICRVRYTKTSNEWSLLWRDRNLRFCVYDLARPTPHIEELIREVERDPTCVFWG